MSARTMGENTALVVGMFGGYAAGAHDHGVTWIGAIPGAAGIAACAIVVLAAPSLYRRLASALASSQGGR